MSADVREISASTFAYFNAGVMRMLDMVIGTMKRRVAIFQSRPSRLFPFKVFLCMQPSHLGSRPVSFV